MLQIGKGKGVDISAMENSSDALTRGRAEELKRNDKALRERMSPKGKLKLPPLLERRRWELGIPDGAFARQAVFDRVYIHQFDSNFGEAYVKGGLIIRPPTAQKRQKEECPTGVLLSAGLSAMDSLYSEGIGLGHVVNFTKLAVYRLPVDDVAGMEVNVIVLPVGAICGSHDLEDLRRRGLIKRKVVTYKHRETGQVLSEHIFVDQKGKRWTPQLPFPTEE